MTLVFTVTAFTANFCFTHMSEPGYRNAEVDTATNCGCQNSCILRSNKKHVHLRPAPKKEIHHW